MCRASAIPVLLAVEHAYGRMPSDIEGKGPISAPNRVRRHPGTMIGETFVWVVDNRRLHEDSRHYDSHEAEKAMLLDPPGIWQIMGIMDSGMQCICTILRLLGTPLARTPLSGGPVSEPRGAAYRSRA